MKATPQQNICRQPPYLLYRNISLSLARMTAFFDQGFVYDTKPTSIKTRESLEIRRFRAFMALCRKSIRAQTVIKRPACEKSDPSPHAGLVFRRIVRCFVGRFRVSSEGFRVSSNSSSGDFILDHPHQFAHAHVKRCGNAPEGFDVGVLAAVLDHRKMATCDTCQSGEYFL